MCACVGMCVLSVWCVCGVVVCLCVRESGVGVVMEMSSFLAEMCVCVCVCVCVCWWPCVW